MITMGPTWCLVGLVCSLAIVSSVDVGGHLALGLTTIAWTIVCLLWAHMSRSLPAREVIRRYDWRTTLFLVSIFVLVEGLVQNGVIDALAAWAAQSIGGNPLLAYVSIVALSVGFSAFVNNVPYVAAMLPMVEQVTATMQLSDPIPFYFGLLIGASVGGNITPIGASANIVTIGTLARRGHTVTFDGFARIGLPYTLASVAAASAFVWLVFGV